MSSQVKQLQCSYLIQCSDASVSEEVTLYAVPSFVKQWITVKINKLSLSFQSSQNNPCLQWVLCTVYCTENPAGRLSSFRSCKFLSFPPVSITAASVLVHTKILLLHELKCFRKILHGYGKLFPLQENYPLPKRLEVFFLHLP